MGLDMYLVRTKRVKGLNYGDAFNAMWESDTKSFGDTAPQEPLFDSLDLEAALRVSGANLVKQTATVEKIERYDGKVVYFVKPYHEVGYWRKANAIHAWFVQNVQDGDDDCEYHEVSKERLLDLQEDVRLALEAFKAKDFAECGQYLPTQSGFFFGSTEYDDWYEEDLQSTLEIIEKALRLVDFKEEVLLYRSSW